MLLKSDNFRKQVQSRLDALGWTAKKLSVESGAASSAIYRLLNGESEKVRRAEAIKIAEALNCEWQITGSEIVLRGKEAGSIEERRKIKMQGIEMLLKNVDYESLATAEEIMRVLVAMEKMNLLEMGKFIKRIQQYEQSGMLAEKLRAFAVLMMPFEEKEFERVQSNRSVFIP